MHIKYSYHTPEEQWLRIAVVALTIAVIILATVSIAQCSKQPKGDTIILIDTIYIDTCVNVHAIKAEDPENEWQQKHSEAKSKKEEPRRTSTATIVLSGDTNNKIKPKYKEPLQDKKNKQLFSTNDAPVTPYGWSYKISKIGDKRTDIWNPPSVEVDQYEHVMIEAYNNGARAPVTRWDHPLNVKRTGANMNTEHIEVWLNTGNVGHVAMVTPDNQHFTITLKRKALQNNDKSKQQLSTDNATGIPAPKGWSYKISKIGDERTDLWKPTSVEVGYTEHVMIEAYNNGAKTPVTKWDLSGNVKRLGTNMNTNHIEVWLEKGKEGYVTMMTPDGLEFRIRLKYKIR